MIRNCKEKTKPVQKSEEFKVEETDVSSDEIGGVVW